MYNKLVHASQNIIHSVASQKRQSDTSDLIEMGIVQHTHTSDFIEFPK
jgi:hypothetical protein